MTVVSKVLSIFPTPAYLSMPAVGLDISDRSVKFVEFSKTRAHGRRLLRHATVPIPRGAVEGGRVIDKKKLIGALSTLTQEHGVHFVRVSLPEEEGYIFPTYIPHGLSKKEIREALVFKLEENIPIAPDNAVIDFEFVPGAPIVAGQQMVSVSAFPEKIAQEYVDILTAAGLEPLSLEIEAQAIARSVVPKSFKGTTMIVDIGRMRSGISVVRGQATRFTATVDVGGDEIDDTLQNVLPDATSEDFARIKNGEGLRYEEDATAKGAFESFAKKLATELDRYVVYWQTHKDIKGLELAHTPVEKIILVGGNANIAGLPEYLENALRISVSRGDVWQNAFSLDAYVPNVPFSESLGYASAIGLALHEDE